MTRALLRRCSSAYSVANCVALFAGNIAFGLGLFVLPDWWVNSEVHSRELNVSLAFLGQDAAGSNLLDALMSLALLLLTIILLLHRLLWPLASRTLYALAPTKVRKGVLVAVGSALLAFAEGSAVPALVQAILDHL
jgi:hypothetical protein